MKSDLNLGVVIPKEPNPLEEFLEEKLQIALNRFLPPMRLIDAWGGDQTTPNDLARLEMKKIVGDDRLKLQDLITRDPRFCGNAVKMIHRINGRQGFYPQFVGEKLLQRIFETGSVSSGISWLEKVLSSHVADQKFTAALWNVPISSEVQLAQNITLIPFEDLEDNSRLKADLQNSRFLNRSHSNFFNCNPPSSALVIRCQDSPFFVDFEYSGSHEKNLSLRELMADIALLLTLIGPRASIDAGYWFSLDDPDLEFAFMGPSLHSKMIEIMPVTAQIPPKEIDAEEAKKVIKKFEGFESTEKKKIKVAIDRLRCALIRHKTADKAVELSIALETLCGDKNRTELSKKMSKRPAKFLGGDLKVQIWNETIFRKVYKVRGDLVHEGKHPEERVKILKKEMESDKVIFEACSLCATLIKKIISRGSFPKWSD